MTSKLTKKHNKQEVVELASDEEKAKKIHQILSGKLKNHGKLFKPTAEFYQLNSIQMAESMLSWLGVSVEEDGLVWIEVNNSINQTGLYFQDDNGLHHIYVNSVQSKTSHERAAVIAHEIMHLILIGIFNFRLEDRLENEKLTDMATIYAGLGLLVLNGFSHKGNNWGLTSALLLLGVIHYGSSSKTYGYYTGEGYGKLLGRYIKINKIEPSFYAGYILPASRYYLTNEHKIESRKSKNKTALVKKHEKRIWRNRIIGGAVVAVVLAIIVSAGSSSNTTQGIPADIQTQLSTQKQQLDQLKASVETCTDDLNSRHDSVNQYNDSEVNQYNSDLDKCKSLENQYNSDVDLYNAKLKQYQ